MKIGLLLCDHVREEFMHIQGDYPDMFEALLPDFDFEVFEVCQNQFPVNVNDCDAYLATGSRYSVYDDFDWITRLKGFVQEIYSAEKIFVGVCFGHQLLAEALGGKVEKSAQGWCVGVDSFDISEPQDWMQPHLRQINLLMMCQDQVKRLPPNSKLLASSVKCPVGMFRVGKRMLGIQAHPEFSKAYDQALMQNRIDRMGYDTVNAGIQSLKMDLHQAEASHWISNFLKKSK